MPVAGPRSPVRNPAPNLALAAQAHSRGRADPRSGSGPVLVRTGCRAHGDIGGRFVSLPRLPLHRFHKILREISLDEEGDPTYRTTPGQAVGYHFIPIYSLVWIFKWPI